MHGSAAMVHYKMVHHVVVGSTVRGSLHALACTMRQVYPPRNPPPLPLSSHLPSPCLFPSPSSLHNAPLQLLPPRSHHHLAAHPHSPARTLPLPSSSQDEGRIQGLFHARLCGLIVLAHVRVRVRMHVCVKCLSARCASGFVCAAMLAHACDDVHVHVRVHVGIVCACGYCMCMCIVYHVSVLTLCLHTCLC